MPNTEDRMDIVLESIFQEAQQPANWDKPFPWKPNVAIHFKKINKQFQPVGDLLKARTNGADGLWMFQAMGGKNGKGHFFDIMTESGDNPKPWTSFSPVAELYKNGQSSRILPPEKEAPLTGPSQKTQAARADTAAPPEPVKAAAPIIHKTAANGEKLPPIAATYLDQALFVPQSDAWWRVKDAINLDGAIISNSFHYASLVVGPMSDLAVAKDLILDLAGWFESVLRETKSQRQRERLTMMFGLCTTEKQVTEIVNQGWASLPKSHYDTLRVSAKVRLEMIKTGAGTPGAGTPTPEAPELYSSEETSEGGTDAEKEIPF